MGGVATPPSSNIMWQEETSKGYENRKCRDRVLRYLHGTILDIGCGDEKITQYAIGIDIHPKADLKVDLTRPDALDLFNAGSVDVVFSSHFLEHVIDYEGALRQFWRVLKPHGKLILYLPHRDLYPRIGEQGANPDHKHDFAPQDILGVLDKFAKYSVIRNETHAEDNEYSFELIISKDLEREPERDDRDSVLVMRHGAFGDLIIASPIFRVLAQQYRVIAEVIPESVDVLLHNPHVADIYVQQRHIIPCEEIRERERLLEKKYKKVITLHESVERTLLLESCDEAFFLSKPERHFLCNKNYYDFAMQRAGLPVYGVRPELYLSHSEQFLGDIFRQKNKDYFTIQWQVTGSSTHKIYPYAEYCIDTLLEKYPNVKIYLTGGGEFQVDVDVWNRRVINKVGQWTHRQAAIMTKFMDLVVSPETGVLNASGAFDTPKIGLLTHSTKENLTKYYVNDHSLESLAPCAPCHRLVHDCQNCDLDTTFGLPICMSQGHPPERILEVIDKIYAKGTRRETKERRTKERIERRAAGSVCLRDVAENRMGSQQREINAC